MKIRDFIKDIENDPKLAPYLNLIPKKNRKTQVDLMHTLNRLGYIFYLSDNVALSQYIIDKMIQLAAKVTERWASDIVYDINELTDAIKNKESIDKVLFFRENGVTTRETNKLTAERYNGLLCCFTPIQTWRLTYNSDTMETKLIRVNVRKDGLF